MIRRALVPVRIVVWLALAPAILMHELMHYLAVWHYGGTITGWSAGWTYVEMEIDGLESWGELVTAIAPTVYGSVAFVWLVIINAVFEPATVGIAAPMLWVGFAAYPSPADRQVAVDAARAMVGDVTVPDATA